MLRLAFLAGCLLLASTAAAEDCRMPNAPEVPDGATASDDQMVAAHTAVQEYVTSGNAYIVCLTKLRDAADPNTPAEQIATWTQQHNTAVDRMKDVADRFNAQLRIWKARGSTPPG
jgi:hypothetical protein